MPGEIVLLSGTGRPNDVISIKVIDEEFNILYYNAAFSDAAGFYNIVFIIPEIAPRILTVTAGNGNNVKSYALEVYGICGPGIADTDSDGDGTPDCVDNCPDDSTKADAGSCGCGVSDTDGNGDGTADCNDDFPQDPEETADNDDDGTGDIADSDDDNDGMPDRWERDNGLDVKVADANGDADSDGLSNLGEYQKGSDSFSTEAEPIVDDDNDNIPDDHQVPEGSEYDLDGDGTPDTQQAGMMAIALPDGLPMGLYGFRCVLETPGQPASVRTFCSTPFADDATWYKYDEVNGWQDFGHYAPSALIAAR